MKISRYYFLFLLFILPACTDGIVQEPTPNFPASEIQLPPPVPVASKEPETPLEHVQFRSQQAMQYVNRQRGLVWPVLLVIGILWGLSQILRLIVQLTTSSPI